jgi:predicted nucleotidyltransferase component of viral defense system
MRLHENETVFKEAILLTAMQMNILDAYVEKDYWVTLAIHSIFTDEIGKDTVFKGGTALAKCSKLIERFSEDIDLVVIRKEDETNNQLKTKIKKISKRVSSKIKEVEIEGTTHKVGMIRKTAHNYKKCFENELGEVRDLIVVESTWLGHFEPYTKSTVSSYIYEMMLSANQHTLIEEYNMKPFEVQVLKNERTLCEKIMSLVRFSQTVNPIADLTNKTRHIYDIHMMLKDTNLTAFFEGSEFNIMLLKVANDDALSFKSNNSWLKKHPATALLFNEPINTWKNIKSTYSNTFKRLVYGEFPHEEEILKTLLKISNRLKKLEWNLIIKNNSQ